MDSSDGLVADPKFSPWSHREISFSTEDQWATIPKLGRFPLILDPCINNIRFECVLIDSGSSIDILFRNSLAALKLTQAQLKPYGAQFWGVIIGQSSIPLGQITLPVQFGTLDHLRIEFVNFVVTDFDGTYHTILGHPSLTKFMVVPHYSYLVLKMPTEKESSRSGAMFTQHTLVRRKASRSPKPSTSRFRWQKPCPKQHKHHPTSSKCPSNRPQGRTSSVENTRKSDWLTTIPRRRLSSGPTWILNKKTRLLGL